MIIIDNLVGLRKGRLWINNLPKIEYTTIDVLKAKIKAEGSTNLVNTQIALELLLPNEVSNYALLGADFTPNDSDLLTIEVCISKNDDLILSDTIAKPYEEVHVGIPREYAQTIIDTVQKTLNDSVEVPSGILRFNCGAHGYIGSSQAIFSKVTRIILVLITCSEVQNSCEGLKEVVLSELSKPYK